VKLLEIYKQQILDLNYEYDEEQVFVLKELQRINDELINQNKIQGKSFFSRFLNKFKENISGLYLYGGVGLGKTFLVDLFFNNLKIKGKKRIHFHAFMREFHSELKKLENIENPVDHYIKKCSKNYKILVLDEFIVEDIADAMILDRILNSFIKYKVVLVTTSNTKPDDLYKDGLQREYFLEAIEIIKNNNIIIHLEGISDYRKRFLKSHNLFNICSNDTNKLLSKYFAKLSGHSFSNDKELIINSREINIIGKSARILWIEFRSICETNRSADDYLEIVKLFQVIMISDIPVLDDEQLSSAKRFINLIDVLYDNNVALIVSSYSLSIDAIYKGSSLKKDFQRTKSRIFEMTNQDL